MRKFLFLSFFLCGAKISFSQNYDRAIDSLINIEKGVRDDSNNVNRLNLLALNSFHSRDFETAMNYANRALATAEKINFRKGIADSYNQIGAICERQCNYFGELKNSIAALKIEEEINYKPGMANSYGIIGDSYLQKSDFSKALRSYSISLKISQDINDKYAVAESYNRIGGVYLGEENLQEALKNYSKGLQTAKEIGDRKSISVSNLNIGTIYQKQGKFKEAKDNYLASLKIKEEEGDKEGIADCVITLGQLVLKQHNLSEAREYLNKGLSLSKEIGRRSGLMDSYYHLSVLDSMLGNYKEAYILYKMGTQSKDSILNRVTNGQISQLTIQYETEKKDQQLKTKDLQNRILQTRIYYSIAISLIVIGIVVLLFYLRSKRKKQEYEHALIDLELTVLKAQLNPHFISNSLSTIKWFFDRQPERASQFLAKFAKLIRRILEQSELPFISLREELETAELYMHIESLRLKNGFDFHIECDPSIDLNLTGVPPLIRGLLKAPLPRACIFLY